MIVDILDENTFARRLMDDEYATWSYDGAVAIYEYLEQISDDTGEPIEFCKVAIRCDFHEYKTIDEALEEYQVETLEELQDETLAMETKTGGVVVNTI